MKRIGVFICQCGPILEGALDIFSLAHATRQLKHVVYVESVSLLCAPDAKAALVDTIRAHAISHVVIAACAPREHEKTFRKILAAAGLNPFMLQIAGIREHCAWVVRDRQQATDKAMALIQGAVQRAYHHQPLEEKQIDVKADVLVIGAGMAGISAALTLAQQDRRVYLVEQSPWIGGKVALYEDLYPDMNCAACLIESDLDTVLHHDRIEVITLSRLVALRGGKGNFTATLRTAPRWVDTDRCLGCAACTDVCPVNIPNPVNAFLDQHPVIHIPYPGALPHVAVVDRQHCLRTRGESCTRCQDACPFDAIDYDQTESCRDVTVGAVVVATGFKTFAPDRDNRYGHADQDHVITSIAFERLVNESGPTQGKIVNRHGRTPEHVAFVHCVGSRTKGFNPYCSGVCCQIAIKQGKQVKRQLPQSVVHHIFVDLCLPGKSGQRIFDGLCTEPGIVLHRMKHPGAVRIDREDGKRVVHVTGPDGIVQRIQADLVILATALEPPAGARQLAACLNIDLDQDGFFKESHPITDPTRSSRQGIYLAGCCQGPKDIPMSVTQGQAAAGRIQQWLVPGGKMVLDPIVAGVDTDLCSGCRTCEGLCPFGAITGDEKALTVNIEETLCRGCGICAAACPSGALGIKHFSRDAVEGEIAGLLRVTPFGSPALVRNSRSKNGCHESP